MTDTVNETVGAKGHSFFSYGFRPFFFSATLFAGLAVPLWILILSGVVTIEFLYPGRDWHVHEMVFGFLPAVITGFLLTAIPNWTDRPPISGRELMGLWGLWVAGRLLMLFPWFSPPVSAIVDGAFLIVVAGLVWREIVLANSWFHAPMGVLITVYASANMFFHVRALSGAETDVPERMALALVMVLLALIGGRVTPNFTGEYLSQQGLSQQPAPFSRFDGLSVVLVVVAGGAWAMHPLALATGLLLIAAGMVNMIRILRWQGWLTWREPLVLVLHLGYGWLVLSLLVIGCAVLGVGIVSTHAVHALTAGAVGV
ncbi:MAG: NnrS family protein, partial [Nitrospira sp.]|nr:NnrS family protein [Nitrospira sp.]